MNENLQQAMAEIIQASLSAVETAKNFLSEQIPDVIQQLLLWHFTVNLIYFVCGIFLLAAPAFFIGKAIRLFNAEAAERKKDGTRPRYDDPMSPATIRMTIAVPVAIISALIAPIALNLKWLQIWIAPKIFLIEYAARMFK